jgi:hypothetical protein
VLYDRTLRAGILTARLEGSDLRYVKVGGLEVIRRLYVAVRDSGWNTIPGEVADFEVRERDDRFSVTWSQRHRAADVDFAWHGEIEGRADGALVYAMSGEAGGEFAYNRIGICVLHPREAAGAPYRAWTPLGELEGRLPREIGPQLLVDGKLQPLFQSYDAL